MLLLLSFIQVYRLISVIRDCATAFDYMQDLISLCEINPRKVWERKKCEYQNSKEIYLTCYIGSLNIKYANRMVFRRRLFLFFIEVCNKRTNMMILKYISISFETLLNANKLK